MKELIESISNDPLLKAKLQMLQLATELGSVSEACARAGFSRDTYYRVQKAFSEFGIEGLTHKSRGRVNLKARVSSDVEDRVVALAKSNPTFGKLRISKILCAEGLQISPAGVRIVLVRNGLWQRTVSVEHAMRHGDALSTIFG